MYNVPENRNTQVERTYPQIKLFDYMQTFPWFLTTVWTVCDVGGAQPFFEPLSHTFFAFLMLKEILINAHVLTFGGFVNFISFKVFYKQPTDGERVCTLHSPIGPFWSHALFLIPLRTCFIAFSPHPASDQTEITGQLLVLDCLIITFTWGKRTDWSQRFLAPLLIWTDTLNVSTGVWMLARCC